MTRGDKFLLAGLLCTGLFSAAALYGRSALFIDKGGPIEAVITSKGKVVRKITLPVNVPSTFVVQGRLGSATVAVKDGQIRMLEASCPGGICLKQGWIEHPGQSIACIPGEILVRIEGAARLDAVTR